LFKLVNRQNFKEPKKIPVLFFNAQFLNSYLNYLKPIDACQTKANKRKNTGIAGMTSTIGRNAVYGSLGVLVKPIIKSSYPWVC